MTPKIDTTERTTIEISTEKMSPESTTNFQYLGSTTPANGNPSWIDENHQKLIIIIVVIIVILLIIITVVVICIIRKRRASKEEKYEMPAVGAKDIEPTYTEPVNDEYDYTKPIDYEPIYTEPTGEGSAWNQVTSHRKIVYENIPSKRSDPNGQLYAQVNKTPKHSSILVDQLYAQVNKQPKAQAEPLFVPSYAQVNKTSNNQPKQTGIYANI